MYQNYHSYYWSKVKVKIQLSRRAVTPSTIVQRGRPTNEIYLFSVGVGRIFQRICGGGLPAFRPQGSESALKMHTWRSNRRVGNMCIRQQKPIQKDGCVVLLSKEVSGALQSPLLDSSRFLSLGSKENVVRNVTYRSRNDRTRKLLADIREPGMPAARSETLCW